MLDGMNEVRGGDKPIPITVNSNCELCDTYKDCYVTSVLHSCVEGHNTCACKLTDKETCLNEVYPTFP